MDETENKIRVRKIIIALSLIHKGDWQKIMHAVQHHEVPKHNVVEELVAGLKCGVTTIIDKDYPEGLRHAHKPPFALYYYGNISLLQEENKVISYVGARMASDYGAQMAKKLCEGMAQKGYTVASGLAIGIDKAAGEAALPYGKAVAVLGNGIDYVYPSENAVLQSEIKEKGLLISEYPGDTQPTPDKFPMRNRIIAGVGRAVVVGEAYQHSGTLITVSFALDMGRDVLAVPFRGDEGSACNLLIKEGAPLVENVDDILNCLGKVQI
ncbi:MAG: DNA-processing protein DprA [Candidatus Enteromonas sp.]|jgi:DNA processing protein|nr:DNA-processing protein DprA [Candidatus Enteromonas sp.]MEE3442343.1 DNA-processing protein DprA [Candidatus Enteromonas sp.]